MHSRIGEFNRLNKINCTCSGNDGAAVGAHGQVENTVSVTSQGGDLLHLGIFPDVDLVLGVSVSADKLVCCLTEHQVADLGSSIDCLQFGSGEGIPETDCTIGSSSS